MNLKKKISTFLLTFLFILSFCAFSASAAPSKVKNVKIRTVGNTAALSWSKVKDAKGYNIYKLTSNDTYKKVKTTTSTSVKFSGLTYFQTYSFKVCAYDSSNTEGPASSVVTCKPATSKPSTPKNFQYTALGDRAVTLKWSRVSGASGYEISKYDKKTKSYQTIRTINNPGTVKIYIQKLTDGETYRLSIRSFKSVKGGKVYSNYSDLVTFTAAKFSDAVKAVRAPYYTVKTRSTVTVTNKTKDKNQKLKSGTALSVTSKTGTMVTGHLSNGDVVTVKRSALQYTGLDSSTKNDYSTSVKEKFINLKGLSSSTNWLIWVSESKLRVNIFKGSRGNWKLMHSAICCVGRWNSRTAHGIRKILRKIRYGEYGGPDIAFSPGTANGGSASNPMGCRFHNLVDGNYGKAVSHGCVRLKTADLLYIYNNCPVGTTVYVY